MTAMQDEGDLEVGTPTVGIVSGYLEGSGPDAEIEELRAEVARLHTLLVTENVGLSVGILMVHRRCGAREALAGLVGLALSSGRTMAQEADILVARYDPGAPGPVDVSRLPPTV